MSTTENEPREALICHAGETATPLEIVSAREQVMGAGLLIRRLLPQSKRRMVGPWCFLDHFGPLDFQDPKDAMWVGPHPHIGLQTVTWLLEGEVTHRDSLGSFDTMRPGHLNVMTCGRGITHTEETPQEHGARLHGLQFWVALPYASRDVAPAFDHFKDLPITTVGQARVHVFAGRAFGVESPARFFSPIVGYDARLDNGGALELSLDPTFEHGVIVVEGEASLEGQTVGPGELAYLGVGRGALTLKSSGPVRVVVVGGAPFEDPIVLWWNFVGHSPDEVATALEDWNAGAARFGTVEGFDGDALVAPAFVRPSWPPRNRDGSDG